MITRTLISALTGALALTAASAIAVPVKLVEFDFAGAPATGGDVGTYASNDAQFTVINSAVTFSSTTDALSAIGGASGTAGWVYEATGTAAANTDLHTGSVFGSPTRFDLDLGLAASGFEYTITRAEIDIRASNSTGTSWDFMYRKPDNSTVVLNGTLIATQGGADPISTYFIDLPTAITATDGTTDWNVSGTGELRFGFYSPNGTGPSDNFQVDAIRVIGTVVPEPSSLALLGLGGLAMMRRRR